MIRRNAGRPGIAFAMAALFLSTLVFSRPALAADPSIEFEKYTLPNGIEVILHQDRRVPLVAVSVWYHVGSGDEIPNKSGFAHLFEHMMFQGSVHTGPDAHFDILKKIGASGVNGSTNPDRTNYYEVVPSHQLETALWLESDRMGYLLPLLDEKSLDNQREVVRNERRQRYDNVPYGKERFAINEQLFAEGHPYRYLTIGKHEDLAGASAADVRGFFKTWYVPANATLTIAGDFEIAEAKKQVEKWFGSFPASKRPAHTEVAPTPVTATKRVTVSDPFAKLRRIHYVWHTPKFYAPGDAELDILGQVLGNSGTGRLYKVLVHEKQLAQSVSSYHSSASFSGTFHVVVDLKSDAELEVVERILDEELGGIQKTAITQREFDRAVIETEAGFVWGLEPLLTRAELLQSYNHYLGKPDFISGDLDRYRKSTPEKIRGFAAQYLGKANRVEVLTTPAEKSAEKGASQ